MWKYESRNVKTAKLSAAHLQMYQKQYPLPKLSDYFSKFFNVEFFDTTRIAGSEDIRTTSH